MLIPKQIAALVKIAAKQSTRYAQSAIRIERHNGSPRAMATDGHRAILFSWEEGDASTFPPIAGMTSQAVPDFAANIPPQVLVDVSRGVPARSPKPILSYVLLDESNRQTVRLAATTLDKVTRAEAQAEEGSFPPVDDVLPQPAREGNVYDRQRHGPVPFTHIRIAINAKQLAQTLAVLADLAAEEQHHTVVLTVPLNPAMPIRADARRNDCRGAAVIMPISANLAAYDDMSETPPTPATPAPQAESPAIAAA